jgi:glycine dehydrogenase subunit 1
MALIGPAGLARVARACHANALALRDRLTAIPGVERGFGGPIFHEFVLRLAMPVAPVLRALREQGILGGLDLTRHCPELGQSLLVCATETKNETDLIRYSDSMARIVAGAGGRRPAD